MSTSGEAQEIPELDAPFPGEPGINADFAPHIPTVGVPDEFYPNEASPLNFDPSEEELSPAVDGRIDISLSGPASSAEDYYPQEQTSASLSPYDPSESNTVGVLLRKLAGIHGYADNPDDWIKDRQRQLDVPVVPNFSLDQLGQALVQVFDRRGTSRRARVAFGLVGAMVAGATVALGHDLFHPTNASASDGHSPTPNGPGGAGWSVPTHPDATWTTIPITPTIAPAKPAFFCANGLRAPADLLKSTGGGGGPEASQGNTAISESQRMEAVYDGLIRLSADQIHALGYDVEIQFTPMNQAYVADTMAGVKGIITCDPKGQLQNRNLFILLNGYDQKTDKGVVSIVLSPKPESLPAQATLDVIPVAGEAVVGIFDNETTLTALSDAIGKIEPVEDSMEGKTTFFGTFFGGKQINNVRTQAGGPYLLKDETGDVTIGPKNRVSVDPSNPLVKTPGYIWAPILTRNGGKAYVAIARPDGTPLVQEMNAVMEKMLQDTLHPELTQQASPTPKPDATPAARGTPPLPTIEATKPVATSSSATAVTTKEILTPTVSKESTSAIMQHSATATIPTISKVEATPAPESLQALPLHLENSKFMEGDHPIRMTGAVNIRFVTQDSSINPYHAATYARYEINNLKQLGGNFVVFEWNAGKEYIGHPRYIPELLNTIKYAKEQGLRVELVLHSRGSKAGSEWENEQIKVLDSQIVSDWKRLLADPKIAAEFGKYVDLFGVLAEANFDAYGKNPSVYDSNLFGAVSAIRQAIGKPEALCTISLGEWGMDARELQSIPEKMRSKIINSDIVIEIHPYVAIAGKLGLDYIEKLQELGFTIMFGEVGDLPWDPQDGSTLRWNKQVLQDIQQHGLSFAWFAIDISSPYPRHIWNEDGITPYGKLVQQYFVNYGKN